MTFTDTCSIRKSILIYICAWLFLSMAHTLWTEPLIAFLYPGFHNVQIFLFIWVGGLVLISGCTLLALAIRIARVLRTRRKVKRQQAQTA